MTKIEESLDHAAGPGFIVEVPKRKVSSNLNLDPIGENTDAQEFQRKISTGSRDHHPQRKISTDHHPQRKISTDHHPQRKISSSRPSRLYSIHSLGKTNINGNRTI